MYINANHIYVCYIYSLDKGKLRTAFRASEIDVPVHLLGCRLEYTIFNKFPNQELLE